MSTIEDKINRFADKERHQLFRTSGISFKGLEKAEMMRTGYAIEYDMVLPHQQKISGLYSWPKPRELR